MLPEIQYFGRREDSRSEQGFGIHIIMIDEDRFEIAARTKRDAIELATKAYIQ